MNKLMAIEPLSECLRATLLLKYKMGSRLLFLTGEDCASSTEKERKEYEMING